MTMVTYTVRAETYRGAVREYECRTRAEAVNLRDAIGAMADTRRVLIETNKP